MTAKAIITSIEELLDAQADATDSLGVKLFVPDMQDILAVQKRHMPCICDGPNMSMYTSIGTIAKGKVRLPVVRCSRGTTSLESFHLHVNRMIPGCSASGPNMQSYLMEDIYCWNICRQNESLAVPDTTTAVQLKI